MTLDASRCGQSFRPGRPPGRARACARRCARAGCRSRSPAARPLPDEIRAPAVVRRRSSRPIPSCAASATTRSRTARPRSACWAGCARSSRRYYLDQVAARYRVAAADRGIVSRAPGAFLDQSFRRVRRQAAGARARRHAGERSDPAARRGRFVGHAARRRIASGDDPVPRQPGFDRSELAARAASQPARVGRRSQARHQRESGARNSRAAHARRERRLHAAGRHDVRARAHGLVGRHRPASPAAASSASSRFTTPRTSRAPRRSWARATVSRASRSRAPC